MAYVSPTVYLLISDERKEVLIRTKKKEADNHVPVAWSSSSNNALPQKLTRLICFQSCLLTGSRC